MVGTPKKKRRWPFAGLLGLLLLLLLGLSVSGRQSGSTMALEALVTPLEEAVYWVGTGFADTWRYYLYFVDLREKAADLTIENRHLRLLLMQQKEIESENIRLRRLLGMKRHKSLRYKAARVVALDLLGQFRTARINLGYKDGLLAGAPVIDAYGVVGRIVELGDYGSRVLLMIDPQSSIDGRIVRTRAQGLVQGTADRSEHLCQLAFSLRTEDLRKGDEVVTSGLDGRFPPGLLLGTIQSVSKGEIGIFQEARLLPAANFDQLEEVLVITGESDEP